MTRTIKCLLVFLGFCGVLQKTGGQILGKPMIEGSSAGLLKDVVFIYCEVDEVPDGLSVQYQLFMEGNLEKAIGDYTAHENQQAEFPLVVQKKHDGRFICKASGHNNTEVMPTYSDPMRFRVIEAVKNVQIRFNDSEAFWEGDNVTLQCSVGSGTYVTYDWILDGKKLDRSHSQLTIESLSTSDSGTYACMASNQFNDTLHSNGTSRGISVRVKERLSDLEILFIVVKESDGSLSALVKCEPKKGTPPVTFRLFKNNEEVAMNKSRGLRCVFAVPITLDEDMGMVYCQASDGTTTLQSGTVNLTVESVGGAVTMRLDKTIKQEFEVAGVWLQCSVERGTFPHYYWYLNNTRLKKTGTFHFILRENDAVIAFLVGPMSDGIYHCEAANAFDSSTRVQSQRRLVSKKVLNTLPVSVVALVFTCFSLLIVAVTACCLYGLVLRKRKPSKPRRLHEEFTEMSNIGRDTENEDEYMEKINKFFVDVEEEYMDFVEACRTEESDEDEEEYYIRELEEEIGEQEEKTSVQEEESST